MNRFNKLKNRIIGAIFDQSDRAVEILEEILSDLAADMEAKSIWTGGLGDLQYSVKKYDVGKRDYRIVVHVTDKVFNILDEGVDKVPRYAASYGLKAFPIVNPRIRTMTTPDTLNLKAANALDKTIFRPVIYSPIEPRNFMEQIEKRLRERIADEGWQVKITVSKEKGDG